MPQPTNAISTTSVPKIVIGRARGDEFGTTACMLQTTSTTTSAATLIINT